MKMITHSEEETRNLGKTLALQLKGGDIVCLYGELGAGKTTFVKGVAEGLEIKNDITSPTFTLMNIYQLVKPQVSKLIHIDTYRLKNENELIQIGAEDYIGAPDSIAIIEWPEKIEKILSNKNLIQVHLNHGQNQAREITVDLSAS